MQITDEAVARAKASEEIWETTGSGAIWVNQTGVDGSTRSISVGGRPGMKLRISQYDRLRNQERCVERSGDVFTNGMLVPVNEVQDADGPDVISDEEMVEVFALRGSPFAERVDTLNEYNVRRMLEAAERVDATGSQLRTLQQALEQKWPIGGDTPMYRELKQLNQVATDQH